MPPSVSSALTGKAIAAVALQWLLGCTVIGGALALLFGGHGAAYFALLAAAAGLAGAVVHSTLLCLALYRAQTLPKQVLVLWLSTTIALVAGISAFSPMTVSPENVAFISLLASIPILVASALITNALANRSAA